MKLGAGVTQYRFLVNTSKLCCFSPAFPEEIVLSLLKLDAVSCIDYVINARRMREGYCSQFVCLSVCVEYLWAPNYVTSMRRVHYPNCVRTLASYPCLLGGEGGLGLNVAIACAPVWYWKYSRLVPGLYTEYDARERSSVGIIQQVGFVSLFTVRLSMAYVIYTIVIWSQSHTSSCYKNILVPRFLRKLST